MTILAAIGPKPPTTPRPTPSPGPTGPRPRAGHQPPGADTLADLVAVADDLAARLQSVIRQASTAAHQPAAVAAEDAIVPGYIATRLICAAADINSARGMFAQILNFGPAPARTACTSVTTVEAPEAPRPVHSGAGAHPPAVVR